MSGQTRLDFVQIIHILAFCLVWVVEFLERDRPSNVLRQVLILHVRLAFIIGRDRHSIVFE